MKHTLKRSKMLLEKREKKDSEEIKSNEVYLENNEAKFSIGQRYIFYNSIKNLVQPLKVIFFVNP